MMRASQDDWGEWWSGSVDDCDDLEAARMVLFGICPPDHTVEIGGVKLVKDGGERPVWNVFVRDGGGADDWVLVDVLNPAAVRSASEVVFLCRRAAEHHRRWMDSEERDFPTGGMFA